MNIIVKPGAALVVNNAPKHNQFGCEPENIPGDGDNCECPEGGLPGSVGPQGPQGEKGDKGDPGQNGRLDLSFDEQFTGAYDRTDPTGPKKIYVKTFDCGTTPARGGFEMNPPHGIQNINRVLSVGGFFINQERTVQIDLTHPGGNQAYGGILVANEKISIYYRDPATATGGVGNCKVLVTLEYTKNE